MLLELRALLDLVDDLNAAGRDVYEASQQRRWALQRLWIAIGNTAEDYRIAVGVTEGAQPWQRLKQFRNDLAHRRLPDIDDDWVWRTSQMRTQPLRDLVARLMRESADLL